MFVRRLIMKVPIRAEDVDRLSVQKLYAFRTLSPTPIRLFYRIANIFQTQESQTRT